MGSLEGTQKRSRRTCGPLAAREDFPFSATSTARPRRLTKDGAPTAEGTSRVGSVRRSFAPAALDASLARLARRPDRRTPRLRQRRPPARYEPTMRPSVEAPAGEVVRRRLLDEGIARPAVRLGLSGPGTTGNSVSPFMPLSCGVERRTMVRGRRRRLPWIRLHEGCIRDGCAQRIHAEDAHHHHRADRPGRRRW